MFAIIAFSLFTAGMTWQGVPLGPPSWRLLWTLWFVDRAMPSIDFPIEAITLLTSLSPIEPFATRTGRKQRMSDLQYADLIDLSIQWTPVVQLALMKLKYIVS